MNEQIHNNSQSYTIYKVTLTREQQRVLSRFLPPGYSFQQYTQTRSHDQQSLISQNKIKKKTNAITKDPDFIVPNVGQLKQTTIQKIQSTQVIPGGQKFAQCYFILKKLKKLDSSWPFKLPVDPKALGIPQYFNIVQQPMDLKTIQQNIKKQSYEHPSQFHCDIYKIFMNSYKFNQKDSEVYQTTLQFQEEYLKIMADAKEGKLYINQQKKPKTQEQVPQQTQPKDKPFIIQSVLPIVKPVKNNTKKQKYQKILKQQKSMVFEEDNIKSQDIKPPLQKKQSKIHNNQLFFNFQKNTISVNDPTFKPTFSIDKQQKNQEYSNQYQEKRKIKNKPRQNKPTKSKKSEYQNESIKQQKQLKQNTILQNQKNIMMNNIQKRLADLNKKLGQYNVTKKIKNNKINQDNQQHPNYTNFTTISAAEKKKLVQKIGNLPNSELRYIIQIFFRNKRNKHRQQSGQYEIDLQKADPKTLKQISNFVNMRNKKIKKQSQFKQQIKHQINEEDQDINPIYDYGGNPYYHQNQQIYHEFHPHHQNPLDQLEVINLGNEGIPEPDYSEHSFRNRNLDDEYSPQEEEYNSQNH